MMQQELINLPICFPPYCETLCNLECINSQLNHVVCLYCKGVCILWPLRVISKDLWCFSSSSQLFREPVFITKKIVSCCWWAGIEYKIESKFQDSLCPIISLSFILTIFGMDNGICSTFASSKETVFDKLNNL